MSKQTSVSRLYKPPAERPLPTLGLQFYVMAYLLGLLSFPNEILSSNWALQGASLPSTGRQGRPWQTGDLENMSCQLPILLSFPLALCQRNDLITGCINRNMMVRTKEVH